MPETRMNTGVLRLLIFQGVKRPTRSQSRRYSCGARNCLLAVRFAQFRPLRPYATKLRLSFFRKAQKVQRFVVASVPKKLRFSGAPLAPCFVHRTRSRVLPREPVGQESKYFLRRKIQNTKWCSVFIGCGEGI